MDISTAHGRHGTTHPLLAGGHISSQEADRGPAAEAPRADYRIEQIGSPGPAGIGGARSGSLDKHRVLVQGKLLQQSHEAIRLHVHISAERMIELVGQEQQQSEGRGQRGDDQGMQKTVSAPTPGGYPYGAAVGCGQRSRSLDVRAAQQNLIGEGSDSPPERR